MIARGVERRAIFRDDVERVHFAKRPARLVGAEAVVLSAYVLLHNHLGIATASAATHLRATNAEAV